MRYFIKTILFTVLLVSSLSAYAQPRYRIFDFMDPKLKSLSVHLNTGLSSYFGDLCPTGDCYTKSKLNFGFGVDRRFNDYLSVSVNAQYYRISGADAVSGNSGMVKRNLSFRADNFEFSATGNFEFLNYNSFRYLSRSEFPISMFAFVGVGITTNNPMAEYNGEYVALRPLKTEGKSYSGVAGVFPVGLGIGYRINNQFNVSLLAGYRFTTTDYLDDVSSNYVDPNTLEDKTARDLAYRGIPKPGADPNQPYYGVGSRRGGGSKDGYLLVSLKAEYFLPVSPFLFSKGTQKVKKNKSTLSVPTRGTSGGGGGEKK